MAGAGPVVTADVAWMRVKVKPGSRESALEQAGDGTWIARLKSPPVEGRANAELIALVARRFGRPKAAVTIKGGASGRTKLLKIELPSR